MAMAIETGYVVLPAHVEQLCALFAGEWWSVGRARADVERMLRHCEVVTLSDGDRLVGFARAVTDYAYKALVLDVIVAPSHRGTGLGRRLMDAIMQHPELSRVRHFELYCKPEMKAFYEDWGYTTDVGDIVLMRYSRSQ